MVRVIGEALVDLVQQRARAGIDEGVPEYRAHPGGSPYNVAIGLARLGQHSQLQARLSDDSFGRQLRQHAQANGVDLSLAVAAAQPTTLAIVGLDEQRNATYDFYLDNTADWFWSAAELAAGGTSGWVHTGSLASWTSPGAEMIRSHLQVVKSGGSAVISYDPNIRPMLMSGRCAVIDSVEAMVALADVVKASDEDLAWLYPDIDVAEILRRWQSLGPAVVVVTEGAAGARAITPTHDVVSVPARPISVVDTVGAGDAFMAGLINALLNAGFNGSTADLALRPVIEEANLVAALTCQRPGANPPTARQLQAAAAAAAAEN